MARFASRMKYANRGAIRERTIGVEAPLGPGWLSGERLYLRGRVVLKGRAT